MCNFLSSIRENDRMITIMVAVFALIQIRFEQGGARLYHLKIILNRNGALSPVTSAINGAKGFCRGNYGAYIVERQNRATKRDCIEIYN